MIKARLLVGVGTVGALVAAGLALSPVGATPEPGLIRGPGYVTVPAGASADNPAVTSRTPVRAAALSHVERYAATLGVDADQLSPGPVTHTVAGTDVVRLDQVVDGVPVMGGEVVVSVGADRELASALAKVSDATTVRAPVVSEDRATATARAVTAKASGARPASLIVTRNGRQLFDPAVTGAPEHLGIHTVWSFEVGDGVAVRRTVLIDVVTGAVVLNADEIQEIDRVVCDADSAVVDSNVAPCDHDFARTETSGPSAVAEVNNAFDLSGAAADFYDQVAGIDLTDMLGIEVGGSKKLASTVRVCTKDFCPYDNAFWGGTGMYYGVGYTAADDVVAHEITHGYIEHTSNLYYWRQSGAINESMADVIGEIVDHRHPSPGDSPDDWRLGEDLPIGALRDMADPTWNVPGAGPEADPQPDRMTNPLYVGGTDDSAGVHTNSGVGNKTAYLISQGGTFNGQTITGIDGADLSLTKTATLYVQTIPMLASGSGYADLAVVLDQACQQLIGGSAHITAANCTAVHKAGLATELTTTPAAAPQPEDAPRTCPSGRFLRVLLDGNAGQDPTTQFDPERSSGWGWGDTGNASSGRESWWSAGLPEVATMPLTIATPVALPAGQPSYLWFQQSSEFEYDSNGFYDGGKVELDGTDTADLPWVNGPDKTLATGWDNPASGTVVFGGDTFGWYASRLDLSSYAGGAVTPSWVQYDDVSGASYGWFIDDIAVYTCDPPIANVIKPSLTGAPKVGKTLTATPGTWTPAAVTLGYAWLRNGTAIKGATKATYRLTAQDKGKRVSVRVTAVLSGQPSVALASKAVGPVR